MCAKKAPDTALAAFLDRHPKVDAVEAFVTDINGTQRGKLLPLKTARKIFTEGLRMPRSVFAVDIWGEDALAAGLVSETGDNDGTARPVPDGLRVQPWSKKTAQVMLTMFNPDGRAFGVDPRQALSRVLGQYKRKGLTPVVAVELEFYLTDKQRDDAGCPQPPRFPAGGGRAKKAQILGMAEVAAFRDVLDDIRRACALEDIPADTLISENGPAQFEVNLLHTEDALRACDDAIFLKRTIKGIAQKHGMEATFMAKPYAGLSGNGMHVHFSLLDKNGKNIFAGKDKKGTAALRHAIGGLLRHMPASTAVFAPHFNSYRRFAKGSHAPVTLTWGYDNRSVAVRVPDSSIAATRIEHRVAGADANPYLVMALLLAAGLDGMEKKTPPGKPLSGNAYAAKVQTLPVTWGEALDFFEGAGFTKKALGRDLHRAFLACKRQEMDVLAEQVTSAEYDAYFRDA
ncbi:MAG: glutamine synthetase family protein [Alphaproteobacteria bacterium]|nr:glutamine synthetase family protein [Alphaproteobacteria bacterium]